MVAEFTLPDLLAILGGENTSGIEYGVAVFTKLSISGGDLSLMLQAIKRYFEDICIKFNCVLFSIVGGSSTSACLSGASCLNLISLTRVFVT